MDAPILPLALLGIGAYLAFFGVHYWRSDLKYPTDPIKSVLQGKGLPANTATPTAEEAAISGQASGASGAGAAVAKGVAAAGAGPAAAAGQQAGSGATAAGNQQLGKMLAASYGWSTGAEWTALVALWNRESGWSNTADTRVSGLDPKNATVFAYGIPQARPYSKMPKAAWPPDKGGTADPTHQINWGLAYIKASYGDPIAANNYDSTHPGY